eukprot:gene15911-18909_t
MLGEEHEEEARTMAQMLETDEPKFYDTVKAMMTEDTGLLRRTFDDVYWELVHALIEALNEASKEWNPVVPQVTTATSQSILSILEWMSLHTSAREFLLVVQELLASSFFNITFYSRLSLIGLISNALRRIDVGKRYSFLKTFIPLLIKSVQGEQEAVPEMMPPAPHVDTANENDDDDDEEESATPSNVRIIGQEQQEEMQQKNSEKDLKWEYPLSCILSFISIFVRDLNIQDPIEQSTEQTDEAKQQHLLLQSIFELLGEDSVINPPQPLLFNGLPVICIVGELLGLLGVSFDYVLATDARFRLKRREMELEDMYFDQGLDEEDIAQDEPSRRPASSVQSSGDGSDSESEEVDEDEEDDTEEMMWDINLSYSGIGYFLYHVILRPTEHYRLPSPLSPLAILKDNLPYIITLLQKIGFKAIQIVSFLYKRIKSSSVAEREEFLKSPADEVGHEGKWLIELAPQMIEAPYHLLQMVQCAIGFLVKCPVQKVRSYAFAQTTSLFGIFTAATRFNLLATLIRTCIFPSFTGLLIHIFKEAIDAAWLSTEDEEHQYFVSPKLLEVLTVTLQVGGNLLERLDSIMNALNLYRYLLIRDKSSNLTGVWSRSRILGSRDSFLLPLSRELGKLKDGYANSASGDQDALRKALKGISKLGVDDMATEDIQKASQLVVFHIELSLDVVNRILELQDTLKLDDDFGMIR